MNYRKFQLSPILYGPAPGFSAPVVGGIGGSGLKQDESNFVEAGIL